MYVSDYYYGALPTHWTKPGWNSDVTKDYRSAANENWIHMGHYEWTISPFTDNVRYAFYMSRSGFVHYHLVYDNVNLGGVRPVFNLAPSVELVSGSGSKENPYWLK